MSLQVLVSSPLSPVQVITEEEIEERDALLQRVSGSLYCMCFRAYACVVRVCVCACEHVCASVPSMRMIVFACLCHSHSLQVQDMYFANPPIAPNLVFYKEVFHTLVKFNDR